MHAPTESRTLVVKSLPALPAALSDLLRTLGRDDVDTHALGAKIAHDPALAAATLRLANSSFYGVPRHVSSLSEATAVLGLRAVRGIVTTAALNRGLSAPLCDGFDFDDFWRHAIAVAVTARLVALELGADDDAAFTAGLLHDVGRLVLAGSAPERYAEVLACGDLCGVELVAREQAVLRIDHCEAGALAAGQWRLPASIVAAIGGHHAVTAADTGNALAWIVCVADATVTEAVAGPAAGEPISDRCRRAWDTTGLPTPVLERLADEAALQATAIFSALHH